MIAILSRAVSFPRPPTSTDSTTAAEEEEDEDALPDSQLFVFPPGSKAHAEGERVNMGTVTALQTGKGTMSCPEGYRAFPPSPLPLQCAERGLMSQLGMYRRPYTLCTHSCADAFACTVRFQPREAVPRRAPRPRLYLNLSRNSRHR